MACLLHSWHSWHSWGLYTPPHFDLNLSELVDHDYLDYYGYSLVFDLMFFEIRVSFGILLSFHSTRFG
jgi:hypothetical protein